MKIPSWDDAARLCQDGVGSPLDWFVYDHEPLGSDDEALFREELQDLVDFITILGQDETTLSA